MDLMYLPDAFTFHVIRSPAYDAREYLDAAWQEEEERLRRQRRQKGGSKKGAAGKASPCPRSNALPGSESPGRCGGSPRSSGGGGGGKGSCPLCKERKRRSLATYIRTKSRQDSECTIEEEEEEGEEGCAAGGGAAPEGCPLAGEEERRAVHHCAS